MSLNRNGNSVSAKFLITYATADYVVIGTGCGTSRINTVLYLNLAGSMILNRNNYFFIYRGDIRMIKFSSILNRTYYSTCRISSILCRLLSLGINMILVVLTGHLCSTLAIVLRPCISYICNVPLMTESVNSNSSSAKLSTTNGTVGYIVIRTVLLTLRSNLVLNLNLTGGMAKSCNLTVFIAITTCTSMSGITTCSTSRISYNLVVRVNVRSNTVSAVIVFSTIKSFFTTICRNLVEEGTAGNLNCSLAVERTAVNREECTALDLNSCALTGVNIKAVIIILTVEGTAVDGSIGVLPCNNNVSSYALKSVTCELTVVNNEGSIVADSRMNRCNLTAVDGNVAVVVNCVCIVTNVVNYTAVEDEACACINSNGSCVIATLVNLVVVLKGSSNGTAVHNEGGVNAYLNSITTVAIDCIDGTAFKSKLAVVVNTSGVDYTVAGNSHLTLNVEYVNMICSAIAVISRVNSLTVKVKSYVSVNSDSVINGYISKKNYFAACVNSSLKGLISLLANLCYCNKCINVAIHVAVATSTSVSGITLCIKGGRSYNGLIRVTGSSNLVTSISVTTRTSVSGVTTCSTSRSGYRRLVIVTGSSNLVANVGVTTCTSVSGITTCSTSRSGYRRLVIVTGSCNLITGVGVATCTSVSGITCFGTGRRCYNCVVRVLSNIKLATLVTVVIFVVGSICTLRELFATGVAVMVSILIGITMNG